MPRKLISWDFVAGCGWASIAATCVSSGRMPSADTRAPGSPRKKQRKRTSPDEGEGWRGRGDRGAEGGAGEEVHVGGGGGAFSHPLTRGHVWGVGGGLGGAEQF